MKFGYARVSKNDQSLDVQVEKLKAAGCDEIFQEDRRELARLMERLRPGDTVCEVRLDRLGRRMMKLIQLIEDFSQRRVHFVSLENNSDTATPMGMLLFSICAAFAEMERALIRELVLAGLSAAQAQGRRGGRPKFLTREKQATLNALRQTGQFSVSQICATVGITRSVYYQFSTVYCQFLRFIESFHWG